MSNPNETPKQTFNRLMNELGDTVTKLYVLCEKKDAPESVRSLFDMSSGNAGSIKWFIDEKLGEADMSFLQQ